MEGSKGSRLMETRHSQDESGGGRAGITIHHQKRRDGSAPQQLRWDEETRSTWASRAASAEQRQRRIPSNQLWLLGQLSVLINLHHALSCRGGAAR
jgi:hypothetical protein